VLGFQNSKWILSILSGIFFLRTKRSGVSINHGKNALWQLSIGKNGTIVGSFFVQAVFVRSGKFG
jgi:hypothetical protein